eukprot:6295939-Amphidinium_carterae.1
MDKEVEVFKDHELQIPIYLSLFWFSELYGWGLGEQFMLPVFPLDQSLSSCFCAFLEEPRQRKCTVA